MGRNIPSATLGIKLRLYKGMERNSRVRMQSCGGDKIVCRYGRFAGGGWKKNIRRFAGGFCGEQIEELGDLRLVGIADDPRDSGKYGQFLGSALGIAAGGDNANGGIGGVKLSNGVAGLGVSGGRNGAGVDDDDVGGGGRGSRRAATIKQLALEGGAIGLRGAATELFDEESRHVDLPQGTQTFYTEFPTYTDSTPKKDSEQDSARPKKRE